MPHIAPKGNSIQQCGWEARKQKVTVFDYIDVDNSSKKWVEIFIMKV